MNDSLQICVKNSDRSWFGIKKPQNIPESNGLESTETKQFPFCISDSQFFKNIFSRNQLIGISSDNPVKTKNVETHLKIVGESVKQMKRKFC